MEADGPGLAGARALKHAINGEHQTPSNARSSPSSLSLSLFFAYPSAIAYTPSYWPSSISQPVNHMNRFRLRFVFDSNQFVWHFWLFHPLSFNLSGDPPLQLTSEWAVFGMLLVCLFFCCCSWLALSILCSVFKAAGKHSRANTSIESRCLLHF